MNVEKTCAFTGHRDMSGQPDSEALTKLAVELIKEGFEDFLCGMALGFDLFAAEIMLKLRQEYPQIRIIACVPCPNQEKYYPYDDKKNYERLIMSCDEVKILSDHYYRGCMIARDRYMVDNSGVLIAYKRKNEGGTFFTVNYALKMNKKIYII